MGLFCLFLLNKLKFNKMSTVKKTRELEAKNKMALMEAQQEFNNIVNQKRIEDQTKITAIDLAVRSGLCKDEDSLFDLTDKIFKRINSASKVEFVNPKQESKIVSL